MTDQLLVLNKDSDTMSVIDADTGGTVRVVETEFNPPNCESNDVSLLDTEHVRNGEQRPWEIARIPVGIWPGGTVFAPDGERAFVANNKTNDVSVVDRGNWTEVDRYDTELHPDGIASLPR